MQVEDNTHCNLHLVADFTNFAEELFSAPAMGTMWCDELQDQIEWPSSAEWLSSPQHFKVEHLVMEKKFIFGLEWYHL